MSNVLWSNGEDGYRSVRVYPQRPLGDDRERVILRVGNQQIAVSPTQAAEIASGIDHVLSHMDRRGNITAPAGQAETAAPQALPGSGRIQETE